MKYLVSLGTGIGDFFILLPLVRAIKQKDPRAYIVGIAASRSDKFKLTRELYQLQEWYDEICYYQVKEPTHTLRLALQLAGKRFDMGIVVQYGNTRISHWPNRIARAICKKTAGITFPGIDEKIHYDYETPIKPGRHKFEVIKELGKAIGLCISENMDGLVKIGDIAGQEADFAKRVLNNKKIVSLAVGSNALTVMDTDQKVTVDVKQWPYQNWFALAQCLQENGYQVVLLGGNKECKELEPFQRVLTYLESMGVLNQVGKTSLKESLRILHMSELVIGVDTGMVHCAAALNCNTLVLFGPTDANEYRPIGTKSYCISSGLPCAPCYPSKRTIECKEYKCMKGILVEEVYAKALEILSD